MMKFLASGAVAMDKWLGTFLVLFFICGTGKMLIPSSKTIAMMYVIPAVANSAPIQRDLPIFYDAAVEALKDWTKINK